MQIYLLKQLQPDKFMVNFQNVLLERYVSLGNEY